MAGQNSYMANCDWQATPKSCHVSLHHGSLLDVVLVQSATSSILATVAVPRAVQLESVAASGYHRIGRRLSMNMCMLVVSLVADAEGMAYVQVIGVVVADTEQHARMGAQRVQIEYEDLPSIISCEDAIKANSYFEVKCDRAASCALTL